MGMTRLLTPTATGICTFDPRQREDFWLAGDTVMCACPDCQAPMTIRLWLMVADCWHCGCSVELSAEQARHIQALLGTEASNQGGDSAPQNPLHSSGTGTPTRLPQWEKIGSGGHANSIPTAPVPLPSHARSGKGPVKRERAAPLTAKQRQPALTNRIHAAHVPLTGNHPKPRLPGVSRTFLSQMPAWLLSLLFHVALLALLALLFFESNASLEDFYITLFTEANHQRRVGGETRFTDSSMPVQFDRPIPQSASPTRRAIVAADQDARELRVAPDAVLPHLPALQQVKQQLSRGTPMQRTFAMRDPRLRGEIVSREGGTTFTEAAVARGLRWLAQHQSVDGSWSLHAFPRTTHCRGQCGGRGDIHCDSAATSLCLLPFLGAGQTHQLGIYQETVSKGLRWLLEHQEDDGDLRVGARSNTGMYAHGQGAIVLCEAFALTRDEELRRAAQRAIDFIVAAQHSAGGWRYKPQQPGDTSVLGWQLMALQSARAGGLHVPIEAWELANVYLDSVQSHDGSRYAYQPGQRPTHVMTAEALLCRMYLGWDQDFAALDQGIKYLLERHMPKADSTNYYYWYYATQVMHHYGGSRWPTWNVALRDLLVARQVKSGHAAGSWDPEGGHAAQAGRLYSTALAVCTLEVYYRHAPIFRQLNLDARTHSELSSIPER